MIEPAPKATVVIQTDSSGYGGGVNCNKVGVFTIPPPPQYCSQPTDIPMSEDISCDKIMPTQQHSFNVCASTIPTSDYQIFNANLKSASSHHINQNLDSISASKSVTFYTPHDAYMMTSHPNNTAEIMNQNMPPYSVVAGSCCGSPCTTNHSLGNERHYSYQSNALMMDKCDQFPGLLQSSTPPTIGNSIHGPSLMSPPLYHNSARMSSTLPRQRSYDGTSVSSNRINKWNENGKMSPILRNTKLRRQTSTDCCSGNQSAADSMHTKNDLDYANFDRHVYLISPTFKSDSPTRGTMSEYIQSTSEKTPKLASKDLSTICSPDDGRKKEGLSLRNEQNLPTQNKELETVQWSGASDNNISNV